MEDLLIKAATVVAVALAAFSSFPSPSQQDKATQQTSSTLQAQELSPQTRAMLQEPAAVPPQSQTSPAQSQQPVPPQAQPEQQAEPGQQPNVKTVQLQLITGELQDKLDSKSAKQGDSVVLKTREDVKTPDGTAIPKGSKLVGHVTNVQPRGEGKENSQITLQFDRAEVKGGPSLPIESVLESVAPSAGDSTMDNNNGVSPMQQAPGSASAPSTAPNASNAPNGGSTPGMTSNNGTSQNTQNDHPGLAAAPTAQTPNQNAANNMPAPGSIVARSGNVAIRTTSIPGVLVANNISGQPFSNASGMLLGARRDIKLDGGTQMVVGVAAAPQAGGSGMVR